MIENKNWTKTQIRRMCLEGFSQEEIARELNVSEGTVSALMQELKQSDDTLSWQHEIAVVCKKHGISIQQIASNLAFSNAIKRKGFEKNNINNLLQALNAKFSGDGSHSPEAAAEMILQICDLLEKNHRSIDTVYSEIEEKLNLSNTLDDKIDEARKTLLQVQNEKQKALDDKMLTLRKLENYEKCREAFEDAGLDFNNWHETVNVLNNLHLTHQNPDEIIHKLKTIESLIVKEVQLVLSCREKREVLDQFKKKEQQQVKYWNIYYPAIQEFIKLKKMGLSSDSMFQIFEMIKKHQPYLSVDEMITDIDKYGGIEAAIFKEKIDLDEFIKSKEALGFRGTIRQFNNIPK